MIENLESLVSKLQARAAKAKDAEGDVVVGYAAKHALYLHEMQNPKNLGLGVPRKSGLGVVWGPSQYGPKFLEGPARDLNNNGTFKTIVVGAVRAGRTILQALLMCGLQLQRVSQQKIPVEHGIARASAFTRIVAK